MKNCLGLAMWRKKALLSRTTTALLCFMRGQSVIFIEYWAVRWTMRQWKCRKPKPLPHYACPDSRQKYRTFEGDQNKFQNLPCLFSNLFHSGIVLKILPWENYSPSSRLCHRYSHVSALVFWDVWFCPKCCKEPSIYVDIFSLFSQKKHRLLKLKILNHSGDEDLPWSNTGSFVLRHYVSRGSAKFLWILFVLVYFWYIFRFPNFERMCSAEEKTGLLVKVFPLCGLP